MYLSLADQYYIKALDVYPYNLEYVMEHLQYALSYEEDHAQAVCLLGQIYMYQIKDYAYAIECLTRALHFDPNYPDTYKHLSQLHAWMGQYEQSEALIRQGMQVSGMDQFSLLRILALSHEYRGMLKQAKKIFRKAGIMAMTTENIDEKASDIKRVKCKIKASERKSSKNKSR